MITTKKQHASQSTEIHCMSYPDAPDHIHDLRAKVFSLAIAFTISVFKIDIINRYQEKNEPSLEQNAFSMVCSRCLPHPSIIDCSRYAVLILARYYSTFTKLSIEMNFSHKNKSLASFQHKSSSIQN